MPKNTKKCRKAIQKRKKKTTFTPKEKISRVMEEKTFFTAKEREQLFTLYKRLLHLSGDTLQKNRLSQAQNASYQGSCRR